MFVITADWFSLETIKEIIISVNNYERKRASASETEVARRSGESADDAKSRMTMRWRRSIVILDFRRLLHRFCQDERTRSSADCREEEQVRAARGRARTRRMDSAVWMWLLIMSWIGARLPYKSRQCRAGVPEFNITLVIIAL